MKTMKRLLLFITLCLAPVLLLSCACQSKDNPGEDAGQEAKPDPYKPDLSTLEGQWRDSVHTALSYAYQGEVLKIGQYRMPIWWKVYGNKPAGGRSLYISLHGGGQTDPSENDGQWENQKQLYTPSEGVYLCPRAITDTWDLHFRPESDGFYEQIIQLAVVFLDVNPDKVYLMGYSAGGDGVWQVAPRMADHWAAASMMAGHPNGVRLESLRNLPFMIWCGAEDSAYDRNKVCAEYIGKLDALQAEDPEGYVHEGHIVPGKGHWMDGKDAAAVPWMAKYARNPYPKKVVWVQCDVTKEYFYWLGVPAGEARKGNTLEAEIDGNTVSIGDCDYSSVRIYLNEQMVDLSRPVKVVHAGETLFEDTLTPSDALRKETLFTRNDLSYSFPCMVEVKL